MDISHFVLDLFVDSGLVVTIIGLFVRLGKEGAKDFSTINFLKYGILYS